jgi:hypothetical protein
LIFYKLIDLENTEYIMQTGGTSLCTLLYCRDSPGSGVCYASTAVGQGTVCDSGKVFLFQFERYSAVLFVVLATGMFSQYP